MDDSTFKLKNAMLKDEILAELWENAAFDPQTYSLLETLMVALAKEKNAAEASASNPIPQNAFFELSTLRNRNVITHQQQDCLKKAVVGFFGLSVGSHAALTWIMESRADVIKIADPDTVSPTNLNRIRTGWSEVGTLKVDDVKQKIIEIHPYTKVISTTSVEVDDVRKLFCTSPPLDVVVDEIDDLSGKIWLRKLAKKQKIPLISATDVGDNVLIDVERYDTEPETKPFLGRVVDLDPERDDFSDIPLRKRLRLIAQIVGFEVHSETMLDSLLAIGNTLKTWPQLGATATVSGGVLATTIKKILLNEPIKNGRYRISLDEILVSDYNSPERQEARAEKIETLNAENTD